uniref:OSJNBa0044M19.8 protein n=1 Tax=Oryza sativa subsp. japonica TaxID=39947 RepID=Q7XLP8_ORYSJ|nr:OSJNBa0044M19.8 [Oryza sativa Japonica Group]
MACCRALALRSLLVPDHPRAAAAAAARPAAGRRAPRRRSRHLRCCSGGGDPGQPPQEAVLEAISKVARSKGRVALTTNMVLGGTVTDDASDEWLVLDQKVNSYPTNRGFTAIGTGGDDFVQSMVVAVESVLQEPIPKGQVQAVYRAMRSDNRMKYFL